MSLRLRALELYIPGWVARSALRRLFEETASAFGCEPPDVRGLDRRMLLERYVAFSAGCAERALAGDGDLDAVFRRMWRAAFAMGASLRGHLGVRSPAGRSSRPDRLPDDRDRPAVGRMRASWLGARSPSGTRRRCAV